MNHLSPPMLANGIRIGGVFKTRFMAKVISKGKRSAAIEQPYQSPITAPKNGPAESSRQQEAANEDDYDEFQPFPPRNC